MLRHDAALEHAAIIQYLFHAYTINDHHVEAKLEEVAREEMRHFKFLSQAIVANGGDPTIERAELNLGGSPVEQLRNDAQSELDAAEIYAVHRDAIDDPKLKKMYQWLINDEVIHRQDILELAEEIEGKEITPIDLATLPESRQAIIAMLQEDLSNEYEALLRYLHQSFITDDHELGRSLEEAAIQEMKHMGSLAERIEGAGGVPSLEPTAANLVYSDREIIERNIEGEEAARAQYTSHIENVDESDPEGAKAKALWERIKFQEDAHSDEFTERLEKLPDTDTEQPPENISDISTYLSEKTGADANADVPTSNEADKEADKSDNDKLRQRRGSPSLTVGSLLHREQD